MPVIAGKYQLGKQIGSGSWGQVVSATDLSTGSPVAVKIERRDVRQPQLHFEHKLYEVMNRDTFDSNINNGNPLPTMGLQQHSDDNGDPPAPPAPAPPPVQFHQSLVGSASQQQPAGAQLTTHSMVVLNGVSAPAFSQASSASSCASVSSYGSLHSHHHHQQSNSAPLFKGVPKVHHYQEDEDSRVLVMDLLGPSLEDLFNFCGRRFSLKTVLMLGDQMIERLSFVHRHNYVHRDVKGENFTMGIGKSNAHLVYIIDFGLAKQYRSSRTGEHMPPRTGKTLCGTARYASVAAHQGYETSRRDDLEAVGHLLIYFLKGSLPWQGLQATNRAQHVEMIGRVKQCTPLHELCSGLPREFISFMNYCRALEFAQNPDYDHLRTLLRNVAVREKIVFDGVFDWTMKFAVESDKVTDPAAVVATAAAAAATTNQEIHQQEDAAAAAAQAQAAADGIRPATPVAGLIRPIEPVMTATETATNVKQSTIDTAGLHVMSPQLGPVVDRHPTAAVILEQPLREGGHYQGGVVSQASETTIPSAVVAPRVVASAVME